MVLVKERRLARQVRHKQPLQFVVGGILARQPQTRGDAARVSVDDEYGLGRGVEDDRVGGLGADAIDRQQFLAQALDIAPEQVRQLAAVLVVQKSHERFQLFRLEVVIAGGADQFRYACLARAVQALRLEQSRTFQILHCLFDVRPRRVLRQDRPYDHLERGIAGPPVLGTEMCVEQSIDLPQSRFHSGDCSREEGESKE